MFAFLRDLRRNRLQQGPAWSLRACGRIAGGLAGQCREPWYRFCTGRQTVEEAFYAEWFSGGDVLEPVHVLSAPHGRSALACSFSHAGGICYFSSMQTTSTRLRFFLCAFLTSALGIIDFLTGWQLGFFVFYFIPIYISTWSIGKRAGVFIAVYASLIWFTGDALLEKHYSSWVFLYWNSGIRLVADLVLVYLVNNVKVFAEAKDKALKDLQEANSQIKILRGILPICASCKNIRNDKGYWEQIEGYISKHSEADFSHGICENCIAKLYPEYSDILSKKKN